MNLIGVRVELNNKISKLKTLIECFNAINTTKANIYDLNMNGRVLINKQNNIITAKGKQEDKIITGMANFSILVPTKADDKELERIIKIVNVLGNDRLIKEKVKTFTIKQSVLNKIPEFIEIHSTFEIINKIIPGFIETAWYYAPETKTT